MSALTMAWWSERPYGNATPLNGFLSHADTWGARMTLHALMHAMPSEIGKTNVMDALRDCRLRMGCTGCRMAAHSWPAALICITPSPIQ